MNQNTKKLLVAFILVLGFISPFVCSYADDEVKIALELKNRNGQDGIENVFCKATDYFDMSIAGDQNQASFNQLFDTWNIDEMPWIANKPYAFVFNYVEENIYVSVDLFYPDQEYIMISKINSDKLNGDGSLNTGEITINGIKANDNAALNNIGISKVEVLPSSTNNSILNEFKSDIESDQLFLLIHFNKTLKVGYGEPEYKFDDHNHGSYIRGGENEGELWITGDGEPSYETMSSISRWYYNFDKKHTKLYFKEPDHGYGMKLPASTRSLFQYSDDTDKEVYVYERSFDSSKVTDMQFMFAHKNVYGNVNFDIKKVTNMKYAFLNSKIESFVAYNGQDVEATDMLFGVHTLKIMYFAGLKDFSIEPNTFIGDYIVSDYTLRTENEYMNQDEAYDFIDNHYYYVRIKTNLSELQFSTIEDMVYTGEALEPEDLGDNLPVGFEKDEGYTLSYEDNVNVGTAKVIVTGIGEYTGTKELTFNIVKAVPTGTPSFTPITVDGKTLADANLNTGNISVEGTIAWKKALNTTVEKDTSYEWEFTPTDLNNYKKVTGTLVLYNDNQNGGGQNGGSPSGGGQNLGGQSSGGENAGNNIQKKPQIGIHSDNYFESIKNKVSYKDSKDSDWFYPYVNYVTNRQIMNGTGNGMFSPKSRITKAMLVTMLFRLSEDENVTLNNVWVDLKDGKWYTEAAKWALKNGIATANARNEFQPNHELTREEFVKMIYLYANYKNYYTGDENDLADFVDKNMLADDCVNSFKWAVQIGIINGIDTTHLAPKNTSNRAQMATIFTRFMDVYGL